MFWLRGYRGRATRKGHRPAGLGLDPRQAAEALFKPLLWRNIRTSSLERVKGGGGSSGFAAAAIDGGDRRAAQLLRAPIGRAKIH
ncbi:MAG: hypothetical protein HN579_09200 [Gammaproteobacteria bacterium]|jgi:hypothetical protein|nr:hypothetical protein [Gammaproteobacteria bacterium]